MDTKKQLLHASLITALKTPYKEDGSVDLDTFDQLVNKQIQAGVDGLVITGTTGEGHLLTWKEQLTLIKHTVSTFGKQILVIGNTGSNNTKEAYQATIEGFESGMDVALQINPYYGKTSSRGLLRHMGKLLELGATVVYNVPSRTAQDVSPVVIEELAKHANFIGVKECADAQRIQYYTDKNIATWSGNDDTAHDTKHVNGCLGVISVTSNVLPKTMKLLMEEKNPELQAKLQPLFQWLFSEPSPIALNTLLSLFGWIKPVFRLPYVPLTEEQQKQGIAILEALALDEIPTGLSPKKESDFIII